MTKMKSVATAAFVAAGLLAGAAQAAPTLLGTFDRNYGNIDGQINPMSQGAGSCDVMGANAVTVRSAENCQRFHDAFNFGSIMGGVSAITSFVLTIDFSGARGETAWWGGQEAWTVRPAASPVVGSAQTGTFALMGASGPQSWTFDSTLDVFNQIVATNSFTYWMARQGGGGVMSFDLNSARLEVFGTMQQGGGTVSSPGTLALAGLAIFGLLVPGARQHVLVKHRKDRNEALGKLAQTYQARLNS